MKIFGAMVDVLLNIRKGIAPAMKRKSTGRLHENGGEGGRRRSEKGYPLLALLKLRDEY